jgi:hypothetical protein
MSGVGNIPAWDPVLILQGESNYAPWLQSLIRYLGREYWHILLGADRTPSQSDNGEYFVDTALVPSRKNQMLSSRRTVIWISVATEMKTSRAGHSPTSAPH